MTNAFIPRLLISVRNADEARIAVASGCDLLDLKEPHDGSLGMVSPDVARQVAAEIDSVPLSMALGECRDWLDRTELPQLPAELTYVKLGLAGMACVDRWPQKWVALRRRWSTHGDFGADGIAVAYVDHVTAAAPAPEDVVSAAIDTGCRGVLFDTFAKRGRTLFEELGGAELRTLIEQSRAAGLMVALAGSLRIRDLPDVRALSPDIVAVRGAVCETNDRIQSLSGAAVMRFREAMLNPSVSADVTPHGS